MFCFKSVIACQQALRGTLEKEGEHATVLPEFEYLLIGGDDSNDVITLGTCLLIFV